MPAATGLEDPKQTRRCGWGRTRPLGGYRYHGGRLSGGPGGPPGGPPGPGGVHFRGYLITLPVGTKWIFGFFGFFAPGTESPPMVHQHTPPGYPPRPPQIPPWRIQRNSIRDPRKPPKMALPGVPRGESRSRSWGPSGGPPGPRAPGARARGPGGPRGAPGGAPPGGPPDPPPGGVFPPSDWGRNYAPSRGPRTIRIAGPKRDWG